jgi:hypothetical protein
MRPGSDADTHISCSIDYPGRALRTSAAVLTCRAEDPGSDPQQWHRTVFAQHPACTVSAIVDGESVSVRMRDGTEMTLRSADVATEVLASIPYAWSGAGLDHRSLGPDIRLDLDGRVHVIDVQVD